MFSSEINIDNIKKSKKKSVLLLEIQKPTCQVK